MLRAEENRGNLIGSTLLMPELFIKPARLQKSSELAFLRDILARLRLFAADLDISGLAVTLGAKYGLKTPDAIHLATAVRAGAEMFITNNRKDFRAHEVLELDIVYPEML